MFKFNDLSGRMFTRAGSLTQMIEPADHVLIKRGLISHGVIDFFLVFHQSRQNIIQIGNGVGVICVIHADGTFLTCAVTIPDFLIQIAFPTENNKFTMFAARNQHEY